MISVYLNQTRIDIENHCSLTELLKKYDYENSYVAVALNRAVIPRANYASTFLAEGDIIQIVTAMQGG